MIEKHNYITEKLDRIEPAYLANYGLTEAPFSNLHDDRFLYLDAERAQRLNLLQHMTQYSNLLLIVQGERGMGKTSLLTRFITHKADNWYICDVTANTMMDADQLLFQVAQGFGLHQLPQDSGELQEMLYARIAALHRNDQIPILVIDDAHEMPKDVLLVIFHLADTQVDNAHLLRIILFADPQIEKILNAKDVHSLRERVTHTMEIPPLDEETTAEYLKHRMAVAGFNGGSPFPPKMVKRIYKASDGNPERINKLAHEILDKGDFEREEVEDIMVTTQQPRRQFKSGVWLGIAVVLIALGLVFQHRISRLFEDKSEQTKTLPLPLAEHTPDIQPQAQPATAPTTSSSHVLPPATVSQPTNTTPAGQAQQKQEKIIALNPATTSTSTQPAPNAPVPSSPANPEPSVTSSQLAPAMPPPTPTPSKPAVESATPIASLHISSIVPEAVPASKTLQTITINGVGFSKDSTVVVSWGNKDHHIPGARVKLVSDKQLQVQLTVGIKHDTWQVRVADPKLGNSNVQELKIGSASAINDQVLAQEPGMFTLQLFSSHDQKNVEAFIRQHQLGKQANYFVSERKSMDWYSVIYGVYPDQTDARAAIKTLPPSLKKLKPWVRRFDDIQASINTSHKIRQKQNTAVHKTSTLLTTSLPRNGDVSQNESWIWSQDPRYFTLQLIGARETGSVKKFLRKFANLNEHAIYFHTRHDGRDWYAVLYGVYADKQKAREAIKRLPPALQKVSPWIRSFASIHAELARTE